MVRWSFMLAAIPVISFAIAGVAGPRKASPPIAPVAVATEGITARREDDNTFRQRWRPLYDMPPATQVRYVANARESGAVDAVPGAAVSPPALQPSRHRRLRTKVVKLDICARHKMRKVFYGRTWRCRR